MLDFINWLTSQEFGRRCILSVRDILSWVDFLNAVCEKDEDRDASNFMGLEEMQEPEWDQRLDTVTAFIHAACLVYIDGLGSGKRRGEKTTYPKYFVHPGLFFFFSNTVLLL